MIILGLGSNVGDRLGNLRRALRALQSLSTISVKQVSPLYVSDALLPENAPKHWDMPYLNLAISINTQLKPLDLLQALKNIEWSIGRKPEVRHWGPRVLDIDILAWDETIIESETLTVPHPSLIERPFALWPLADLAPLWKFPLPGAYHGKTAAQIVESWGSRFSGDAPFHTLQINHRIDTPQLVGVINVTPDSFSDGDLFLQSDAALDQALNLVLTGAEVIDIGAESTSPTAAAISDEEEWERLKPVLTKIKAATFFIPPKISIDTRHPAVAKRALALGVDWINDVSGLDNPEMQEIIASANVDCVVMHHMSIPERRGNVLPRDSDPTKMTYEWGEARIRELENQGIAREKIIFDPGIGFGKMAEQSLVVLRNIAVFKELGVRVLVGHSRKTFQALITDKPFAKRDIETLAITLYLAQQPIDYLRVHDVEMNARGIKAFMSVSE